MSIKTPNINDLYAKHKALKKEDVANLLKWMSLQPHLPKISEYMVILFLHSNNYSIEATKKCIDNYYTVKNMCPEIFNGRNFNSAEIKLAAKTLLMTPLPNKTPSGDQIFYFRLNDTNSDNYNFGSTCKLYDMAVNLHLQEIGLCPGQIVVCDNTGFSLSHMMKANMAIMKKYMFYIQEAMPLRLKEIHYVNSVPFMDKVLNMFRPFAKKELMDKIFIHYGDNASVFKHIPKECLPDDIGGSCGDVQKMYDNFLQKMKDNSTYYKDEEQQRVDESKRPGKPKNEGDLFGLEGSFKKLDID